MKSFYERGIPVTPTVMNADSVQLASAMRKWMYGNASDQEEAALLTAGYLKLVPAAGVCPPAIVPTQRGTYEAQNKKRVSEDSPVYSAETYRAADKTLALITEQMALPDGGELTPEIMEALDHAAFLALRDEAKPKRVSEKRPDVYAPDDDERGAKPAEGTKIVAMCPECNGERIGEENVAYAILDVTSWQVDGNGFASPNEYDGDNAAEWYTADGPDVYQCRDCGWKGDCADLLYRAKTEDDQ